MGAELLRARSDSALVPKNQINDAHDKPECFGIRKECIQSKLSSIKRKLPYIREPIYKDSLRRKKSQDLVVFFALYFVLLYFSI